jgi:hypothetical protein
MFKINKTVVGQHLIPGLKPGAIDMTLSSPLFTIRYSLIFCYFCRFINFQSACPYKVI